MLRQLMPQTSPAPATLLSLRREEERSLELGAREAGVLAQVGARISNRLKYNDAWSYI